MVRAQIDGVGLVWVAAKQLCTLTPPLRHPPLGEDARRRVYQIKVALDDVVNQTVDEWEDGFRREGNPEQEITIWLHMASVYKACTAGARMSRQERRDCFNVIQACATAPREHALNTVLLEAISRNDAERIIDLFYLRG